MWESCQWLKKNVVRSTREKEPRESMRRCTVRHGITDIMLKTALNTIQAISQFSRFQNCFYFPQASFRKLIIYFLGLDNNEKNPDVTLTHIRKL